MMHAWIDQGGAKTDVKALYDSTSKQLGLYTDDGKQVKQWKLDGARLDVTGLGDKERGFRVGIDGTKVWFQRLEDAVQLLQALRASISSSRYAELIGATIPKTLDDRWKLDTIPFPVLERALAKGAQKTAPDRIVSYADDSEDSEESDP